MADNKPVPGPPVEITYRRSPLFRSIPADGAVGGPSPTARAIRVAFYTERANLPDRVKHSTFVLNGTQVGLGAESERVPEHGIEREYEVELVLDLATAENMQRFLEEAIRVVRQVTGGGSP